MSCYVLYIAWCTLAYHFNSCVMLNNNRKITAPVHEYGNAEKLRVWLHKINLHLAIVSWASVYSWVNAQVLARIKSAHPWVSTWQPSIVSYKAISVCQTWELLFLSQSIQSIHPLILHTNSAYLTHDKDTYWKIERNGRAHGGHDTKMIPLHWMYVVGSSQLPICFDQVQLWYLYRTPFEVCTCALHVCQSCPWLILLHPMFDLHSASIENSGLSLAIFTNSGLEYHSQIHWSHYGPIRWK